MTKKFADTFGFTLDEGTDKSWLHFEDLQRLKGLISHGFTLEDLQRLKGLISHGFTLEDLQRLKGLISHGFTLED